MMYVVALLLRLPGRRMTLSSAAVAFCMILMGAGQTLFGQATDSLLELSSVKPAQQNAAGLVLAYGLTRDDLRRIESTLPVADQIVPVRSIEVVLPAEDLTLRVVGTTHEYAAQVGLRIKEGRFLSESDVRQLDNVVVVDAGLAERMYGDAQPVGKNLRLGDHYFLIVGVTEAAQASGRRGAQRQVYVPVTTMRSRMGDDHMTTRGGARTLERFELSKILITIGDKTKREAARQSVERLLGRFHEAKDYSVRFATTVEAAR